MEHAIMIFILRISFMKIILTLQVFLKSIKYDYVSNFLELFRPGHYYMTGSELNISDIKFKLLLNTSKNSMIYASIIPQITHLVFAKYLPQMCINLDTFILLLK